MNPSPNQDSFKKLYLLYMFESLKKLNSTLMYKCGVKVKNKDTSMQLRLQSWLCEG